MAAGNATMRLSWSWTLALVAAAAWLVNIGAASPPSGVAVPFWKNYYSGWSPDRTTLANRGYTFTMSLDAYSGWPSIDPSFHIARSIFLPFPIDQSIHRSPSFPERPIG
jgi:hypothetical protein